ncbi:MAG: Ig-like domain-containing protein, partial [Mycobacteriales bacterium]
ADLDASGGINVADRALLAHNYGFTADSSTPAFVNYFQPGSGTVWTPGSGGSSSGGTGGSSGGTTGGSSGGNPSATPLHPIQVAGAPNVPTPAPVPLVALNNVSIGVTNGQFTDSNPADPGFGWTTRGAVTVANGAATLTEGSHVTTALLQPFFVPAGAKVLRFTIDSTTLGAASGLPPDAFEAALLDPKTLQPVDGVVPQGGSDALLNVQADGTFTVAPSMQVLNLQDNGGILGSAVPRVVEIDVSQLAASALVVLSLDLLGFGPADSSVVISNVTFSSDPLHNPVANPDLVTTRENTPVNIAVLANDTASGSTLDPKSVTITQMPQHGTVAVDPATGMIRYVPNQYYSRTDSFAYRVRNADGFQSNEAAVAITITPVADTPTLAVSPAVGNQDTNIPLAITAALTDTSGSETLAID